jgi:hypothetical protein
MRTVAPRDVECSWRRAVFGRPTDKKVSVTLRKFAGRAGKLAPTTHRTPGGRGPRSKAFGAVANWVGITKHTAGQPLSEDSYLVRLLRRVGSELAYLVVFSAGSRRPGLGPAEAPAGATARQTRGPAHKNGVIRLTIRLRSRQVGTALKRATDLQKRFRDRGVIGSLSNRDIRLAKMTNARGFRTVPGSPKRVNG